MKLRVPALVIATVVMAACSSSTGPEEARPTAAVEAAPTAGTAITDFTFDASGSSAAERALEYRWDWESDGTWDTDWSAETTATHRFPSGGTIRIRVEVRDGSLTDTAEATINVDDRHGEILERITLPEWAPAKDITFDGAHLWVTRWSESTIKIDPASGDSVGVIPGPSDWTGGIAWDGQHVWTSGYIGGAKLFKQDPATGGVLEEFDVVYTGQCGGLDWDGEAFYYGSDEFMAQGDGLIHRYAPDGTHLSSFASPRASLHPRGLAYDGRDLWVTTIDADTLYVVDAADGTVLRTVPHPEAGIGEIGRGVAVVGDYLWLTVGHIPAELVRVVP